MIIRQRVFQQYNHNYMRASKNKELDYLLINLCEPPEQPDWDRALAHRQKYALRSQNWQLLGTQEYGKYGPGVKLYFILLKYMIGLFALLSIAVLPTVLTNYNGNGLLIYGNSFGKTLMKFSLANQPSLQFDSANISMEQHLENTRNIKANQIIVICNDLLCSLIFVAFLVFWQIKTEALVGEMTKEQTLPSYHTIIIDIPHPNISKDQLTQHFQKFGAVKSVDFVYDYGDFLIDIKQFLYLVERYSQELSRTRKDTIYIQIEEDYSRISNLYKAKIQQNEGQLRSPFSPVKALVQFHDPQLRKHVFSLYKYKVNNMNLELQGIFPKVSKCHVEPLSIIWENFHLKDNKQIARSCAFGFLVAGALLLTLCAIFILSLHSNGLINPHSANFQQPNQALSYSQVVASKDKDLIYDFCAGLSYKTFQWSYYQLCSDYFASFEYHWVFVLALSSAVTVLTLILIKIVFSLTQLRRFRTLPEKKRFLIVSIFISYLISSSLLTLLIRAQIIIDRSSFSLIDLVKYMDPSLLLSPHIQLYSEMNRKWYLHIGKLLFINYVLTLNICPWLYIIEEWAAQKIRQLWARRASTQKQMNERIVDLEFYWQFYYAVTLNSIYFCLLFSIAIPLFYFLAFLSMTSLFVSSKIIFHCFTRQPHMYDHKLNSFIMKAIGVGLILHQIAAIAFLNVEEIFAEREVRLFSKWGKDIIYIVTAVVILVVLMNLKRLASTIMKKESTEGEQAITEEINSSIDANRSETKTQNKACYLHSYKMQDNPYYNSISYTLLILYQTMIEHRDLGLQSSVHEIVEEQERKQSSFLKEHQTLKSNRNKGQYSLKEEDSFQTDRKLVM